MKELLYFTQPSCVPCKKFGPLLEQELPEDVKLTKYSLGTNLAHTNMFMAYEVRSSPTLILLKDDEQVNRHVGTLDVKGIADFLG